MQFTFIGTGIVLCMAVLIVAGCLGSGSPDVQTPSPGLAGTPVKEDHIVANETQNGATVYVNKSTDITVALQENPTTGYQWNLTLSPGLSLINDTYVSSDPSGKLMGAGGTHSWDMVASETGTQTIHAVYRRSWETVTGNETAFDMTVIVQ
ncbi:MAG: protease inhibitor I42 family protein [Methanoregula sp.]|nr:protease inhibitor I42 family protein [Methanoregula sp.]